MKLFNLFVVLAFCVCSICVVYANAVPSVGVRDKVTNGTCGNHVNWTYAEDTFTLTIKGYGDMTKYSGKNVVPWYSYREEIKNVVITGELTSLAPYVLYGTNIQSVTIPATVTKIGDMAFFDCDELTELTIPATVNSLGLGFAAYMAKMKKFILGEGNTAFTVKDDVLYSADGQTLIQYPCDKGSEFVIPDDVLRIDRYAFYGATFEKVKIPKTVTSIGGSAFCQCRNLKSVIIPNLEEIKGSTFASCTSLESFVVPASVTMIESFAFDNTHFKSFAYLGTSEPALSSLTPRIFPQSGEFLLCVPSAYNSTTLSNRDVSKGGACAALDKADRCHRPEYDAAKQQWVLVRDEQEKYCKNDPASYSDGDPSQFPSKGAIHHETPLLILLSVFIGFLIAKH